MKLLSSLTNRIFLASALLAFLCIGLAVYFVNLRVTQEAENELHRGLLEAGTLVEAHRKTLSETFQALARLIADLPKLKAAVATSDPPTVQPIAVEYQTQLKSDIFIVTGRTGDVLAEVGSPGDTRDIVGSEAVRAALAGVQTSSFRPHPQGVLQVVTVPIVIGVDPAEILGTLSAGFLLDHDLAEQFKTITGSEIAFADGGHIKASTLPPQLLPAVEALLRPGGSSSISIGDDEFVTLVQPLAPSPRSVGAESVAAGGDQVPVALVLRSRTERLRFLRQIHTALAVTALLAVLLATLLSYAVARSITRPLATITAAMREVAVTGDLTRKIQLPRAGKWGDEDAQLLASTFNTLTESIARFQRDAAQRERLSSLGRLSTVIAHEIRNPLMIIRASLRVLRQPGIGAQEAHEAVNDIAEEETRLNRIVGDVLDFARPIRFDYAQADLNGICRESVAASAAADPGARVSLVLAPDLPRIVTDGERLRLALVNILANARQALAARDERRPGVAKDDSVSPPQADPSASPDIEVRTANAPGRGVAVVVRDRGIGIEAEDLPHVFDPYFTTKRTGSGLGLAIAKNVVEGLGGAILVSSRAMAGTEIRIELPCVAAGAPSPAGLEHTAAFMRG